MTDSPIFLSLLNAAWIVGLADARVRSEIASQSLDAQSSRIARIVANLAIGLMAALLVGYLLPAVDDGSAAAERIRFFTAKLGLIGCAVVGLHILIGEGLGVPAHLTTRQTLVHAAVGFSILYVYPLENNLRLGIDLAGGTQLIYQIRFSEEAVPDQKLDAVERGVAQIRERLGGPPPMPPGSGRVYAEDELVSLSKALSGKVLSAESAATLGEQAATLAKQSRTANTRKSERATAAEDWLKSVAEQARSSSAESAARVAKELDELLDRVGRIRDEVADRKKAVEDLIATLQRRVDPTAVLGLVWNYEGDRLTIQMPAPKAEIAELRRLWNLERDKLDRSNIDVPELLRLLRAINQTETPTGRPVDKAAVKTAEARLAAIKVQFAATPERVKLLSQFADAAAAMFAAQAGRAATAAAGTPEAEQARADAAFRVALEKFDTARRRLEQTNLDLRKFEDALRLPRGQDSANADIDYAALLLPKTPTPTDQRVLTNARARALLGFKFAQRGEELADAVRAYDRYRAVVSSNIEDLEDLKRELRGAGKLSFHILPDNTELPFESRQAAEAQLQATSDRKPRRLAGRPETDVLSNFRWFLADDEEWQRTTDDGIPYYSLYPPVGAPDLNGHRYILAWDADINEAGRTTRRTLKSNPSAPWKLTRVFPTTDEQMSPAVGFTFDENGGLYFSELTRENKGRAMMIVVDGRAITAPRINDVIFSNGIINGSFTPAEVESLVRKLSAGSLRAELSEQPISEQNVGSTLGADNARKGLDASLWCLVLTAIFMGFYYRVAGGVAVAALVFNIVLTLGAMVFINASMTLPAIAGIVLTIGMAVDANVLIFERLREEREAGVPLRTAIANGYDRAWSAILDSNLTTIISCVILAWVGTGDVRSFGLTLLLGVSISMFTALFATRTLFEILASVNLLPELSFVNAIGKPRVNWMSLLPIFLAVSAVANLWATNSFFGVPMWTAVVMLPTAYALVRLMPMRDRLGDYGLTIVLALGVGPAVLPMLANFGLATDPEIADETARLTAAWNTLTVIGAVVAGGVGLYLASTIHGKGAKAKAVAESLGQGGHHVRMTVAFTGIVLAALLVASGVFRVALVGAPAENFDIEFSTGTSVQLAFKTGKTQSMEGVRARVGELGAALRTATVAPATATAAGSASTTGTENRWTIKLGEPLAGRPPIVGVYFDPQQFPDADSVRGYVRVRAAEKFGGAAVQEIRVIEDLPDEKTGLVTATERSRYQIKTLEDNLTLVDASLRSLFADELDTQERVRLAGAVTASPVPTVSAASAFGLLSDNANEAFYARYDGGVRLSLQLADGETPQTTDAIRKRIAREIARGASTPEGSENIVNNFQVVGTRPAAAADTFTAFEVLGRGPDGTPRLPAGAAPDSDEFSRWKREVADPFNSVVAAALDRSQAFDRIVNFNPQVAAQASQQALSAVLLSWLAIVLYMWIRFGELKWGVAGVVCLVHDVCVALGLLLMGQYIAGTVIGEALLLEAFKVDLTAVAAVLTIIGYSINDTIIVFDRIREVRGGGGALSARLINDSINQTMSRTLLTAFLTWISVFVLYVFGGPGIHVFSFLMLVGILIGCYSSIAIAAPILLLGTPVSELAGEEYGTDKPSTDKPSTDKPTTEKADAEKADDDSEEEDDDDDTPSTNKADAEKVSPDKPNADKSSPDKPNPDKSNPDKSNPDKSNPDKSNPDKSSPSKPGPGKKGRR